MTEALDPELNSPQRNVIMLSDTAAVQTAEIISTAIGLI